MKVAIVGGGIMGISLGYFLSQQGVATDIYEASPLLGGLAAPILLADGVAVDRFYHAILSSDSNLRDLCQEMGIVDHLRFRQTGMGFYYDEEIYPMNGMVDFLKFPPLGWIDRLRLGVTILAAQRVTDWRELETVSVKEWLIRWGGKNAYDNIWRPMLKAKFDGDFDDVPATWVWSRLVRMKSTRNGADQKEEAGYLIGGYITLITRMAQEIEARGGRIFTQTPVDEIAVEDQCLLGLRLNGELRAYDSVIGSVQAPIFGHLVPGAGATYRQMLNTQEYLGIICPLLVLDRPLTGYWTINITDDRVPFTGIIETTAYIDPEYVGGHHLVYLPKYTAPDSELQHYSDETIRAIWLDSLRHMFPDFDVAAVRYFIVHRERFVEPLHGLGDTASTPQIETPVPGLYLVTTAQIYPELTNGESVVRHASISAKRIAEACFTQI